MGILTRKLGDFTLGQRFVIYGVSIVLLAVSVYGGWLLGNYLGL